MAGATEVPSLEEYIQSNPSLVRGINKKKKLGQQRGPFQFPSQQWRLGRNGPMVKRLDRPGPLRGPNYYNPRRNDGLPRLVRKKIARLPITSVFHRLGYNPTIFIARQRAWQARRFFINRNQNNFYNRRVPSMPMGRRPVFWHVKYYRRPWQPRYPKWRKPFQQPRFVNVRSNDDLIKAERQRAAENKLRNVQQNYLMETNRGGNLQAQYQQVTMPTHPVPMATLPNDYPIPSDLYPNNAPGRAPSPEGSIISVLQRTKKATPFTRVNPFANNNMVVGQHQATGNPFMANFRVTPATGAVPFNQRFSQLQ